MLRDRGTIKWTSLMLPEHVELLKEMWQEDEKKNKPTLDTQEIEVMNDRLLFAYNQRKVIQLSIYKNGEVTELFGVIDKLDNCTGNLILIQNGIKKIIAFNNVVSLTIQ